MTEGIILATSIKNYKDSLKSGDLVIIDEMTEEYGIFVKQDDYFKIEDKSYKNPHNQIINVTGGNIIGIMNFERSEISKAELAVYDINKYYDKGIKVMLGKLTNEDIRQLKYKALLEYEDYTVDDIDNIHLDDLVGMTFYGEQETKFIKSNNLVDEITYFKLKKLSTI